MMPDRGSGSAGVTRACPGPGHDLSGADRGGPGWVIGDWTAARRADGRPWPKRVVVAVDGKILRRRRGDSGGRAPHLALAEHAQAGPADHLDARPAAVK
jgi:hypothetical protein